jgi:putative Mn2+ efflux pump MntP
VPVVNITAIALALAMDAFAVAVAAGDTLQTIGFRQFFRLSWHFGLFQAMMPVLGWGAGLKIRGPISAWDHWVAFALLVLVGAHMIKGAFDGVQQNEKRKDPTRGLTLVVLRIAVSIDALAVGLSLSMLSVSIWTPALVIGIVAGVMTIIGMHIGERIGMVPRLKRKAELIGGVVLVAIGIKILYENDVFS